jgi:hypothetical protein
MPYKNKKDAQEALNRWRRAIKKEIVNLHGNRCFDCGLTFPSWMYEFDHRDPSQKSFNISRGRNKQAMINESMKCDMVCPNCHRWRTHRQYCPGCEDCIVMAV